MAADPAISLDSNSIIMFDIQNVVLLAIVIYKIFEDIPQRRNDF